MAGLSLDQRTFLQALMARSVIREEAARKMHAEIVGGDPTSERHGFDRFWGEIASAIGFLDLDIRRIKYQEAGQRAGR